jgi:hypothetical protein
MKVAPVSIFFTQIFLYGVLFCLQMANPNPLPTGFFLVSGLIEFIKNRFSIFL